MHVIHAIERRRAWEREISRRQVLKTCRHGFRVPGLGRHARTERGQGDREAGNHTRRAGPLAPKPPHYPVKAKRIIFLFMNGAISQMDTWDYKPQLQKDDGKVGPGGGVLTGSKFKFSQHGETGTWVSELYPARGPARRQALLHPRPAHRYAGPSGSRDPASYRRGPGVAHPASVWVPGCSMVWERKTRTCPATSRSTRRPISAER